jgi:hypothetical protein
MGKTKSAVAVARRLVCLLWILVTRREFYADMSRESLMKRLRRYKITYEGQGLDGQSPCLAVALLEFCVAKLHAVIHTPPAGATVYSHLLAMSQPVNMF